VKALSIWLPRWEQKGWKTSKRSEVVSKDLFKRANDMVLTLEQKGIIVEFRHIPGHSGIWGNEQADALAVRGAWMQEVLDTQWDVMFDDDDLDATVAEMENI
jgi:ribonuclease HI